MESTLSKPARILFVCLGNICRSPTAEAVLKAMAPELVVDSAGTSDWHIGDPPYGPAIEAGRARGYDLTPLRARQLTESDFREFDLLLAMDEKNLSDLIRLAPSDAKASMRLFLDCASDCGRTDVPDPYYTRDFEGALDLIETGARALIKAL
jgi:protein-tyrosine phosphatase